MAATLISVVNNVGRHRHCHAHVSHGRKCGGIRWNYVSMSLKTEVTWTSSKSPIFFMKGALDCPDLSRYGKELRSRGERRDIQNWTPDEQVLFYFQIRTGRKNI